MNTVRSFLMLAFCLSVAACAYSPQQITVDPVIAATGERFGNGRVVSVVVEDRRENKVLGTRGGAYPKTSTITIGNSLTDAIARSAEATLAAQGFSVNSSAEPQLEMKILVDELVYDKPEDSLTGEVNLKSVLSVELSAGGETYTGRYQTASQRQLIVAASEKKNTEIINEILSQTLQRLFADPKVKVFVSNI